MSVRFHNFGGALGWNLQKRFPKLSSESYLKLQFLTRNKLQEQYINYFMNGDEVPMPLVVNLETINRCNSTCSFCTANKNAEKFVKDYGNLYGLKEKVDELDNTKADKKELDGEWQYCHYVLALDVPLTSPTPLSFDLSSYMPKDENIYEIILSVRIVTGSGDGMYAAGLLKSTPMENNVYFCNARSRTTSSATASGCGIIPLGADKIITIMRTTDYTGKISITFDGFRKVRQKGFL